MRFGSSVLPSRLPAVGADPAPDPRWVSGVCKARLELHEVDGFKVIESTSVADVPSAAGGFGDYLGLTSGSKPHEQPGPSGCDGHNDVVGWARWSGCRTQEPYHPSVRLKKNATKHLTGKCVVIHSHNYTSTMAGKRQNPGRGWNASSSSIQGKSDDNEGFIYNP